MGGTSETERKGTGRRRRGGVRKGKAGGEGARSLEEKVAAAGGRSGYVPEETAARAAGTAQRLEAAAAALSERRRSFATPAASRSGAGAGGKFSLSSRSGRRDGGSSNAVKKDGVRPRNPYSQPSSSRRRRSAEASTPFRTPGSASKGAVPYRYVSHVVCAVSENMAGETCVSSVDAGRPTVLTATKQGNGKTYAETISALELLEPDEVLLNEGRRNSPLARKVLQLFGAADQEGVEAGTEGGHTFGSNPIDAERGRRSRAMAEGKGSAKYRRRFDRNRGGAFSSSTDGDDPGDDSSTSDRTDKGECHSTTVVKFVPRSYYDQTRGAELLRRITREGTCDASVAGEYILLSSAHAVLQYAQLCLGAAFARGSLDLSVNSGGSYRMTIDRATLLNLEVLSNARTGKGANSLIGTIDCTKTSVGSRLLRTNLVSPPTRVDTINARLDLVDAFLEDEEFFYVTMEHLQSLPDVDRMLAHMALVPKAGGGRGGKGGRSGLFGNGELTQARARMASRGIAALVCIKSTLGVIPTFARALHEQLKELDARDRQTRESSETAGESALGDKMSGEVASAGTDEEQNGDECRDSVGSVDESNTLGDEATFATNRSSLLLGLGSESPRQAPMSGESARHQLLRAILMTMKQSALREILDAVLDIFTESTTYSRNRHAMRHQECFALKPNTDGMMDVLRKAFLANVDDIYRLADEMAETYGMTVAVKETTARGYFLSIPADMADDLPDICIQPVKSGRFIHCTTEEVHSLNARSQENVQDLLLMTHERIQEVLNMARARYDALASLSDAIALLDLCHCFADNVASSKLPWCRPTVTDCDPCLHATSRKKSYSTGITHVGNGSGALAVRSGRYAIDVSSSGLMANSGGTFSSEFIPNDTYSSSFQNFTVITGVNGSGKSTYLKQIAIIVILAQCGSYVPAEEAFIPIRDRLCTRIGTCDDQEHNISTFMLEMKETAFICKNATKKSLILIDELGRATSNEDGVAIAWSVSEYLLVKRAMTFFVTHYPQLCKLADVYNNVQNQHLSASVPVGDTEGADGIKYSHKIMPGPCRAAADYGVEMLATCGWSGDVVGDARKVRAEVSGKLPDGALCEAEESSRDHQRKVIRKAESILSDFAKRLVALKESDGRLSMEAKRSFLEHLRKQILSSRHDNDLIVAIKNLLSDDVKTRERSPIPLRGARLFEAKHQIRQLSPGVTEISTGVLTNAHNGRGTEHTRKDAVSTARDMQDESHMEIDQKDISATKRQFPECDSTGRATDTDGSLRVTSSDTKSAVTTDDDPAGFRTDRMVDKVPSSDGKGAELFPKDDGKPAFSSFCSFKPPSLSVESNLGKAKAKVCDGPDEGGEIEGSESVLSSDSSSSSSSSSTSICSGEDEDDDDDQKDNDSSP